MDGSALFLARDLFCTIIFVSVTPLASLHPRLPRLRYPSLFFLDDRSASYLHDLTTRYLLPRTLMILKITPKTIEIFTSLSEKAAY